MKSKRVLARHLWPEEKLLRSGADGLSNEELLATFIGSGVKGADAKAIARKLLSEHGARLLTVRASDLMTTKGIGRTKAARLNALFELACRLGVGHSGHEVAERLLSTKECGEQYSLAELLASRTAIPSSAANKTHLEFFAGIGLVRYALERQGWRILYANDIDEGKRRMYADHFGDDGTFDCRDIHKVQSDRLPYATLATASFPCTDLSLAGGRKGLSGRQSSAFWGFVSALDGMGPRRPPIVLLENVVGFLSSHDGRDFEDALMALSNLGYGIDAFIVDAVHFVPQSRKRLFVVATLHECQPKMEFGMALAQSQIRPPSLARFISTHPGVRWRLRCLPRLPAGRHTIASVLDEHGDQPGLWWTSERAAYLLGQMSEKHRALADEMIAGTKISYGTVFRRVRHGRCMAELRTDGIAGCLRTPKGGSAKQVLFEAGKGAYRFRLLTPRECARLMGADSFRICVARDQALFGFGDAVCVPVIEWIAQHYLNRLVDEMQMQSALAIA